MAVDTCDVKLADKLRREDPEQFHTLVRMHLSFVLDLNTDDCRADTSGSSSSSVPSGQLCPGSILHVLSSMWKDACDCMQSFRIHNHQHAPNLHFICYDCTAEKNKYRPSKWGFVPFAKKPKCLSKGVMEGAPLTQEGICQVYQLIEYLSKQPNNCQEGIFRRSGKLTRQQELKTLLNQGVALNLDNSHFSIHDCASVLKNFLAELPEPLLTDAHYPVYCQIAELCGAVSNSPNHSMNSSETRLLRSLQLLLLLLPTENRVLLRDVLQLLHLTASQESSNKMSADSLSTLFTPHLLCPRKLTPEAFHANSQTMSGVVAFMIRQGLELFEIPPKLATDIRAYWLERERRKNTAEKELNESVCDGTAANTVFSFVDRELTAQAHSANPTEAALAQLYAHIQSLPESSKKRKLIRQFNKGNGQGTPLQLCRGQKHHLRSKSLGDSIKKHIFNKSLKRQKNAENSGRFGAVRSLSQEMLNETMMTPRSRKPVVVLSGSNLCHLANIVTWGKPGIASQQHDTRIKYDGVTEVNNESNVESDVPKENAMMTSCCGCNQPSCPENMVGQQDSNHQKDPSGYYDSGDSLTSTFKSYLMSRSVLTASPVDLSFSSRTGDFDTSSCSESRILSSEALSESLLYCLDGNEPSTSSSSGSGEQHPTCMDCETEVGLFNPKLENTNRNGVAVTDKSSRETCDIDEYSTGNPLISDSKLYRKGVVHETSL